MNNIRENFSSVYLNICGLENDYDNPEYNSRKVWDYQQEKIDKLRRMLTAIHGELTDKEAGSGLREYISKNFKEMGIDLN